MQPMQPMGQQGQGGPPKKKGMSGCTIALIVAGVLALVIGVPVLICVAVVVKKTSDVVGTMKADIEKAEKAPGTAELRAKGCETALVMDTGEFGSDLAKQIGGQSSKTFDAGHSLLVQCLVASGKEMKCADVAKTYAAAVGGHAASEFTAQVSRDTNHDKTSDGQLCTELFKADGTPAN